MNDGVEILTVSQDEEIQDKRNEKKIHMIESRSRKEVEAILAKAGMKRGSQDFRNYVEAKRLIFRGHWITKKIYDQQIQWILSYLGL